MTMNRKARPKRPKHTAIGTCPACKKQIWRTRKDAETAMHARFPASDLSAYPCPAGHGYHFGHLAPQAKSGEVDRRDLRRTPGAP